MWSEYLKRKHDIIRFSFNDEHENKIIDVNWAEIDEGTKKQVSFCLRDWTPIEELQQQRINNQLQEIMTCTITRQLQDPLYCMVDILEGIEANGAYPDLSRNVQIGINAGKLLLYLVDDILTFSHIKANKLKPVLEPFDVMQTINDCFDLFQLQATGKNLELRKKCKHQHLPLISSDQNIYRQILLNLVSNAIKFTFSGKIEVEVTYKASKDCLKTKVIDTGIGIAEDVLRKLFRDFGKFNTALPVEGIGLGLKLCNKLAQALGGEIKVKSRLGQGSKVSFTIKNAKQINKVATCISGVQIEMESSNRCLAEEGDSNVHVSVESEPPHHIAANKMSSPTHRRSSKKYLELKGLSKKKDCNCSKVLVAENNETSVFFLQSCLHQLNISCDEAHNGEQAIQKVFAAGERKCCTYYTLILLEVNMPLMGGIDATKIIQQYYKEKQLKTKIVGLIEESDDKTIEKCLHAGMCEISKFLINYVNS